jgi:hypothetical protein
MTSMGSCRLRSVRSKMVFFGVELDWCECSYVNSLSKFTPFQNYYRWTHSHLRSTYIRTNTQSYIHTYVRTYIHTYTDTYTHLHIHTHTHTYIYTCPHINNTTPPPPHTHTMRDSERIPFLVEST